jgi:hypothetical protein
MVSTTVPGHGGEGRADNAVPAGGSDDDGGGGSRGEGGVVPMALLERGGEGWVDGAMVKAQWTTQLRARGRGRRGGCGGGAGASGCVAGK